MPMASAAALVCRFAAGVTPAYPIPSQYIKNGNIVAGSLAVDNTTSMLPLVQGWIDAFVAQGGRVLASRVRATRSLGSAVAHAVCCNPYCCSKLP